MTTVSRPALNVIQVGGSTTIYDSDGNVRQVIGEQPDGSFGVTAQNGTAPDAPSTPVVIEGTLGLTVQWDGLMAADTVGDPLNENTDFEDSADPWTTPGGGTIAQSSTEAHGGSSSLACTPDGTSTAMSATSELIAVTAGQDYEAECWVWPTDAVTANFSLSIDWFDADQQYLSTDSALVDLSAAEWSDVIATATAPTDAAYARLHPTLSGTPTNVFYLDDITLGTATSSVPADFDHVEIHASETDGFTPSSSTLQGTLRTAGNFPVTPLTGGTEYFVKLVGVNTSGVSGDASTQASGTPSEVVATSIADGIVDTLALADDAVTQAKIAAAAVGTTEIADDAVTTPKIVAGAVEADQIAAGAVDTDKLAANSVTTAKLAALAVTADELAANSVTAGKIDAGAVTADKLESTLVLGTEIVAGDADGARMQLDDTGIAAYDGSGVNTVMIGSDGNAQFAGSSVSAPEIDATYVTVNNGALLVYGPGGTALNTNPDFTTDITGWSNSNSNVTTSYSSGEKLNGHNTLRIVVGTTSTVGQVNSSLVTSGVAEGDTVSLVVTAFQESGMTLSVGVFDGDGVSIAGGFMPTRHGVWVTASFTGVVGTNTTLKVRLTSFNSTGGASNAIYVGKAGLYGSAVVGSMAAAAGTDSRGNTYVAGLSAPTVTTDTLVAGNVAAGSFTQATSASGRVSFTNPFADSAGKFVANIGDGNTKYNMHVLSVASDVVTLQIRDGTTGDPAASGQSVSVFWIGILPSS